MLGVFNLLPLMMGWEYKIRNYMREVNRGASIEVQRISTSGWLMQIGVASSDLYGGGRFKFQGADLDIHEYALDAGVTTSLGALAQDPAGWTQLATQPNPYSTQGAFVSGYTPMWQGFGVPFVPTTIMELYLGPGSTQSSAIVSLNVTTVEITNKESFIKSLRAVMGMPTIQEIDLALLSTGPGEIKVKGVLEEKGEKGQ